MIGGRHELSSVEAKLWKVDLKICISYDLWAREIFARTLRADKKQFEVNVTMSR